MVAKGRAIAMRDAKKEVLEALEILGASRVKEIAGLTGLRAEAVLEAMADLHLERRVFPVRRGRSLVAWRLRGGDAGCEIPAKDPHSKAAQEVCVAVEDRFGTLTPSRWIEAHTGKPLASFSRKEMREVERICQNR